jgi:hypothetical protein
MLLINRGSPASSRTLFSVSSCCSVSETQLFILVKMTLKSVILFVAISLPSIVSAQLASGYPIGPSTSAATKWATKVCDVTKYGAVADLSTDLGPPLAAAFAACKNGGIGESSPNARQPKSKHAKSISPLETMLWQRGLRCRVVQLGVSISKA